MKKLHNLFIVFLLCLIAGTGINAQNQQLVFERLSTQKWMYQSNITCHTQDADGYIWFGTSNGLFRFDGYSVKEFNHDPHNANSIAHNNVNTIHAGRDGKLWIGTWGGLNKLDTRTNTFTRYKHDPRNLSSLSNNDVRSIAEDSEGNLWLGTFGGGIVRHNPTTGIFKSFQYSANNASTISSNFVNVIVRDRSGDMWVGTRRGINKLETDNTRFTSFQNLNDGEQEQLVTNISSILEDSKGRIWFGTFGGGLMCLDRRTGKLQSFLHDGKNRQTISSNYINDLSEGENGTIWIGTADGLNLLNPETQEIQLVYNNPSNPNSLLNNDVRHLFRDKSGVMWIVTAEGINIYSSLSGRFKKIQRNPEDFTSLSSNIVNCFVQDANQDIWIGTREGLNKFDKTTKSFVLYNLGTGNTEDNFSNEIKSLLVDKAGKIWVGTSNALHLFDAYTGKILSTHRFDPFNPNSLNNEIHVIYQTRNGQIWAGNRKGLLEFNSDEGKFTLYRPDKTVTENQISNSVYTILEDRFGRLWAGTLGGGLTEFDRKSKKFNTYRKINEDSTSISHNSVISLCEDPFGFFWIGTYGGGLNRMDRKTGKFVNYTTDNGLPDNMIYSILDDSKGNLWIATNSGIARFDTKTRKFRNYDVLDGLQSNEFNIGSAIRLKNGEMLFGGIAGLNWFYPDSIPGNNFIPPIVITSFKVMDKEVVASPEVILNYNQNYVTFEFSSLSYALADKNRFAYKLEGFDDEWIFAGNRRFATYSNLGPGEYTFMVKGSNSDGLWNEEGISMKLIIKRPFWKTWWFIMLAALVITSILYLGYKYRLRSINQQNQLLEDKVKRRTTELLKASEEAQIAKENAEKASRSKSGFLANMSHEIRTPLNGILGFTDLLIRNNPGPEDKKYLELIRSSGDTLLRLLSDILDLNKIEQGKLNIENIKFNFIETVQQTLTPYQYRSNEKGLQFMLNFDSRIPEAVIGDPTRIKQLVINLVSNSIKFTENGGISISFEAETDPSGTEDNFFIRGIVTDTGIGVPEDKQQLIFDSFTQADGSFTRKYGGSGLGLSIVKQLLRLMSGDIRLISPAIDKPFKTETPGASFVFRFKVKAAPNNEKSVSSANSNAGSVLKFNEDFKILLVEDNLINQLLAVTVLENFGLKVITANDGLQGVEKIKAEDFDLILMDVQMPVMNGYESTAAIRAMGLSIPIIGLTANVYKEDIEKCLESGMNAHLGKPFNEADLFNELKKWLA
jgi:signal transduction histidine kinase/ligand-binding sensor domain-containing protein/CheY-like chemotaxis protein